MLDKYRKELGSEVELLPEGKHFNKFCINLRFRKEKQMSMSNHDRILPDKVADTRIDVPHSERAAVYNIIRIQKDK